MKKNYSFNKVFALSLMLGFACPSLAQDDPKPVRQIEMDTANYYLKEFERYTKGLKGKEGLLTKDGKRVLTLISDLKKRAPDNPRVQELYSRAKAAAKLLKGDRIEVTAEMLAFRNLEAKRVKMLQKINHEAWREHQLEVLKVKADSEPVIAKPFPVANPENTALSKMKGRRVLLEGMKYPDDIIVQFSKQYVPIGTAAKGFYFVDVTSPKFIGAYEAIRRFQREVGDTKSKEWKITGHVVDVSVMSLESGKSSSSDIAFPGWVIEPDAIYVPGEIFAIYKPEAEHAGEFAGESKIKNELANLYTINSITSDASPELVLKTFVTAIKEKNFELYKKCIHPEEQRTPVQKEWVARKWDMFQNRFSRDKIVEVQVGKTDEINVIQGGANQEDKDVLGEFFEAEEVESITDDGRQRSEMITLWLKIYDETGRMREYQKPLTLKRDESVNDFQWFVKSGFPF